jgi:NADH dehydrogenase
MQNQVEIYAGDVTRRDSLTGALEGTDAVVHLVGIISQVGDSTFENVHVHGTQNLLDESRAAGVRRFVHMSALGTRSQAASQYHRTKWAAEEAVRRSGLDYTIFRPSIIFGPEDHFVNLFARIARCSPIIPVMGDGKTRFSPIAVESVARAFALAVTNSECVGQTLDLCGSETLTFDHMLDEILAVLGRRRLKLHVPLALARAQAAFLEWIYPSLLNRAPPLNRDQLIMLQEDNIGRGERAAQMFHLPPLTFRQGIAYLRTSKLTPRKSKLQ